MRSDWLIPLCTGEERLKGERRQEAASDAKAGSAVGARHSRRLAAGRSRARPVLRHRHDRRGGAPAAPAVHRLRARSRICRRRRERASHAIEPMPEPSLATFMTAREAPRVPFTALIERGMMSPGIKLVDAKRAASRAGARRRRDCSRRSSRLDPSHRRAGARPRSLQRLDLLACRDAEGPDCHRRSSREDARRDGRGIVSLPSPSACARTLRMRLGNASPPISAMAIQRVPLGAGVWGGTSAI